MARTDDAQEWKLAFEKLLLSARKGFGYAWKLRERLTNDRSSTLTNDRSSTLLEKAQRQNLVKEVH